MGQAKQKAKRLADEAARREAAEKFVLIDEDLRRKVRLALPKLGLATSRSPHGVEKRWSDFDLPSLLLFILRDVLGIADLGSADKTRWRIAFTYDGSPLRLEYRKFGLTLVGVPKDEEELIKHLRKAVQIVERHLDAFARVQIDRGALTVPNQFSYLDDAYRFLRRQAEKTYAAEERLRSTPAPAPKHPVSTKSRIGTIAKRMGRAAEKHVHAGYLAHAAVVAYFSRTEHVLVLAIPFSDFDPTSDSLFHLMFNATWDEKLSALFSPSENGKRLCERIRKIRERVRNPMAHGGIESRGASLYFHLPSVEALPVRLSERADRVHLQFGSLGATSFARICATFDLFDLYLEREALPYAIKWARSNLDVFLDAQSRAKYRAAMASPEKFDYFLDGTGRLDTLVSSFDDC